jgi:hypothetical protein
MGNGFHGLQVNEASFLFNRCVVFQGFRPHLVSENPDPPLQFSC